MHYQRMRINGTIDRIRDNACSVEDCGKKVFTEGFCRSHWNNWTQFGDPTCVRECLIDGCSRVALSGKRGWCLMHYSRWAKRGDVGKAESRYFEPPRAPRDGYQWCTTCRMELPHAEFNRNKTTSNGLARVCGSCTRDVRVAHAYGIDGPTYRRLLEEQQNTCRICRKPETATHQNGSLRRLCIDHDHGCCPGKKSCGKCVRGLLCARCNSALGLVGENESVLRGMIEYLKNPRG